MPNELETLAHIEWRTHRSAINLLERELQPHLRPVAPEVRASYLAHLAAAAELEKRLGKEKGASS